jgi:cytochrome P450
MSTEDLVATIVLLMAAGFETTRYTIVGGLIALADDSAQLARAREQIDESGALSNDAVEELLRHQGPIHGALPRRSREDESFGDLSVPAGEHVVVMAAAANRDPARYTDPDRLDLDRNEARPLSFGHGPHYCLGANLAKLEINAAVTAVLRLAPEVSCAHRPSPKGSFNVRGPRGAVLGVG